MNFKKSIDNDLTHFFNRWTCFGDGAGGGDGSGSAAGDFGSTSSDVSTGPSVDTSSFADPNADNSPDASVPGQTSANPAAVGALGNAIDAGVFGQTSTNNDPAAASGALAGLASVGLGSGAAPSSTFGQSVAAAVGQAMGMVGLGSMMGLNGAPSNTSIAGNSIAAALGSPTSAMAALGGAFNAASDNPTGGPTGFAGGPTANTSGSAGSEDSGAHMVSNAPPATSSSTPQNTSNFTPPSPISGMFLPVSLGSQSALNTVNNTTGDLSGNSSTTGPGSSSNSAPTTGGYSTNNQPSTNQGPQALGGGPLSSPMYDNTFVNGNNDLQPFVDPYSREVPVT